MLQLYLNNYNNSIRYDNKNNNNRIKEKKFFFQE